MMLQSELKMHPHNLLKTQDEHVHVKDQKPCKTSKA
jgi:hypothetical protein